MTSPSRLLVLVHGLVLAGALGVSAARAVAEETPPPAPQPPVPSPAPEAAPPPAAESSAVRQFPTPAAAAEALVRAFETNDDDALRALIGSESADLVQNGQDAAVRRQREELAAAARTRMALQSRSDGRVTILVGTMEHPMVIPLVSSGGMWRVDAEAGRQELLARRVGQNEIDAVALCRAYVDAQHVYGSADRDGDGVLEYAQRIISTPGQRDGLYWETEEGEEPSPAGPQLTPFGESLEPAAERRAPFSGYYWRVLKAQGSHAPGGEASYLQGDDMVVGFALLAVPAVHGNTGIASFLVGRDGRVLEKDLGSDTLTVAASIDRFDPDPTWQPVDAETLRVAAWSSPGTFEAGGALPTMTGGMPPPPAPATTPGPPCRR